MSSDEGMWDPSEDDGDDSPWGGNVPKLGGKKMERCLVGKQEIMLPEALTEQVISIIANMARLSQETVKYWWLIHLVVS